MFGILGLSPEYFKVPLGLISAVDKNADKSMGVSLEVTTKDARSARYLFPPLERDSMGDKIYNGFQVFAFPKESKYFFAFTYKQIGLTSDGWKIYNDLAEYSRMGISFSSPVASPKQHREIGLSFSAVRGERTIHRGQHVSAPHARAQKPY